MSKVVILTGNSNPELATKICEHRGTSLDEAIVGRFSDGEIEVEIIKSVRKADVFIIQSTQPPAENILELLLMIDAARRASAECITAVVPYLGYGRQERKNKPRVPISAKLIVGLIEKAGANRVVTIDLHTGALQGFFDIPEDNLYASKVLIPYFKSLKMSDLVIVAPDTGSVKKARAYANKHFDCPIAIIDKRRPKPNESEVLNIIGEVKEKNVLIIDDMTDTAGTITEAAEALKKAGAKTIIAGCTHPVLSGPAIDRIAKSCIEQLVVTDTIPLSEEKKIEKIKVVSVAGMLAEVIQRIHYGESVAHLFKEYEDR
jgi:ribose-phosphate pyrophosphokinase